jgi:heptosyltransferase-1
MRILIVKLSSFGDVVHCFPALTDLAEARPGVEIDWLVEEAFAPIARLHPAVGAIFQIPLRRRRWPPSHWPELVRELLGLRRRLRLRQYDLVIDLQGLVKSALVARLAGAPVAGYGRRALREPMARYFYGRRYDIETDMHAAERSRRLVAAAVGYEPREGVGSFGLRDRAGLHQIAGLPERYGIAIHSASWPTKLWPEAEWRRLLARIAGEGNAIVLPWGSEDERARAERLAAGVVGVFVLPEKLTGAELAGVIGAAEFAVGVDTGLMHLANALGLPGVWLYGPTDPVLSGPYGPGQLVVRSDHRQAPCRQRRCIREPGGQCCMRAVAFDRVAAAVEQSLADGARGAVGV